MKDVRFGLQYPLIHLLLTFPLIDGTPFHYDMFQGRIASANEPRQRNKNWCAYVVHKNVSCAVVGGTESFVQPELSPCPKHDPSCAQQVMYRTHFRPVYKIGFKMVTELEWRCCPGNRGHDCQETRVTPHHAVHGPGARPTPAPGRVLVHHGPEQTPRGGGGGGGGEEEGGERGQGELHQEVERLAQMVLDMQAGMTELSSSLRRSLQEDASRAFETLLHRHGWPEGGAEAAGEPPVETSAGGASPTADTVAELVGRVDLHDRQLRLLMDVTRTASSATPPPAAPPLLPPPSASPADPRAYVDERLRALREELLEGMDIKMADLKGSCEYKMASVQEQCEGQETNYLGLAELMDSKEADLRQEIQELRAQLGSSGRGDGDDGEVGDPAAAPRRVTLEDRLSTAEERLSAVERLCSRACGPGTTALDDVHQRLSGQPGAAGVEELVGGLLPNCSATAAGHLPGTSHQTADSSHQTTGSAQELLDLSSVAREATPTDFLGRDLRARLEELSEQVAHCREQAEGGSTAAMESLLAGLERTCARLEPISDSLRGIKEGLNKHVGALWTCVEQLNATARSHARDLGGLRGALQKMQRPLVAVAGDLRDPTAGAPTKTGVRGGAGDLGLSLLARPEVDVMESGEAGPPGAMESSALPRGSDGSTLPVQGFAGAPAFPPKSTVPLKLYVSSGEKVSFSAGLNILPFPGEAGIIRFNKVFVNDGGHYDPNTGVFTAPTDGRYLLSAVLSAERGHSVEAVLSVADRSVQRLHSTGPPTGHPTGPPHEACGRCSDSVSLVLPMRRGERARLVVTAGRMAVSVAPEVWCTFSGVLLYPSPAQR